VEGSTGQRQASARGRHIGLLFLSAIESISIIAAERDSCCGSTSDKIPPVNLRELANIAPREFHEVFFQQSQRLNLTESRGLCTEEVRDIKLAARENFSAQKLEEQSDIVEFREFWEYFGQRYPKLHQFCDGNATVFPWTSTVESELSVLNWECDGLRSSVTGFSLEGIMQCKQFKQL
jgi:hypothetical protein